MLGNNDYGWTPNKAKREASLAASDGSARSLFEKWISGPPYERDTYRWPQDETKHSWPGQYKDIAVQLAWEAWQQARAERGLEPHAAESPINTMQSDAIAEADTLPNCKGQGVLCSKDLLGVTIGDCHLINADCLTLPWIDADALISDPPYGIAYCHGARKGGVKLGTDGEAIIGDDKPFDPRPWLGYPIVVLWGANHYANRLPNSSRWLIWDKREGIPSNDQADGETAWTNQNGVLRLKTRYWNGAQAKEKDEPRIHSNQKPVGLMAWCMEQVGVPVGATVLDPYMGSGTTGIACIRTGRKFIGVEKDKRHFDNAVDRIRREIQGALL